MTDSQITSDMVVRVCACLGSTVHVCVRWNQLWLWYGRLAALKQAAGQQLGHSKKTQAHTT